MAATVIHNGIEFTLIPLEDCLGWAQALQTAGKRWHSHVLSPGCMHNPYPGRYAIVIEDDTDVRAFLAPSDGFPEVDKALVKILHGDDILDARRGGRVTTGDSALLRGLHAVQSRGAHWHHHMHFPACVLNPERGRWCIAIESDGETFSEAFAHEPVDTLREIEILYFRNLEASQAETGS